MAGLRSSQLRIARAKGGQRIPGAAASGIGEVAALRVKGSSKLCAKLSFKIWRLRSSAHLQLGSETAE